MALPADLGWIRAFLNDVTFLVPQTENGTVLYVAFEGRVNDKWEQRAAVFRTAARFWEVGDNEWQINAFISRASHEADWEDPQ